MRKLIPLFLLFTTLCWGQVVGGALPYSASVGATVTAVKTTAGNLFGWCNYNSNAAVVYIQFFDATVANVTLGTTPPKFSLGVPTVKDQCLPVPTGIRFKTAITYAVTTTRTGSTSPASTVDVNFFYD